MQHFKAANWKISIGLPALVMLCCIVTVWLPVYQTQKDRLSIAILIDLLITAPLLYYISIYRTNVSKKTVVRVMMIGLLIAGLILKKDNSVLLTTIKKWIAPLLEVWVVVSLITSYSMAKKKALLAGISEVDFLPFCREILGNITGNKKLGNIIASEIAVIYYSFSFKKTPQVDNKNTFSYHVSNGILLVLGTLLALFLIETTGMHFVFILWSKTAAWLLTLFSAYTCLQLFAHIRSIKARPIHLGQYHLELHNGMVADAIIPYHIIENIEITKQTPEDGSIQRLVLIKGLEGHNCVIRLSETITVTRMFGIEKTGNTILFNCDQPKFFVEALNSMRTNPSLH